MGYIVGSNLLDNTSSRAKLDAEASGRRRSGGKSRGGANAGKAYRVMKVVRHCLPAVSSGASFEHWRDFLAVLRRVKPRRSCLRAVRIYNLCCHRRAGKMLHKKKMLKMQDDPAICMKTQVRATECRSKKRDFLRGNLRRRVQIGGNWPSNLTSVRSVGDALVVAGSGNRSRARVRGLGTSEG